MSNYKDMDFESLIETLDEKAKELRKESASRFDNLFKQGVEELRGRVANRFTVIDEVGRVRCKACDGNPRTCGCWD